MQATATEGLGPRESHASPLWTLQRLCFEPDVAADSPRVAQLRGFLIFEFFQSIKPLWQEIMAVAVRERVENPVRVIW